MEAKTQRSNAMNLIVVGVVCGIAGIVYLVSSGQLAAL